MPEHELDPYKVVISRNELQKLQRWGEWARRTGVLDDYLIALKTINFRLSFEPTEWGEPRYTLQELGLDVRWAVTARVAPCICYDDGEIDRYRRAKP